MSHHADTYSRTGRTNDMWAKLLYSYFPFCEHALQSEVPSSLLRCVIYLVHPLSIRYARWFAIICNCSLPEFFVTKTITQWKFNTSSLKSYCLPFIGIYFHPIFFFPFPTLSISFCNLSMSFLFVIFLYIMQTSAIILIL